MRSKLAKVLHRAGGQCLLEHVIDTAVDVTTPENIVAVIGHQAEQVQAEVAGRGIRFQRQDEQRGTGHAVLCCDGMSGLDRGLILVVYGDCPLLSAKTLKDLVAAHKTADAAATLITAHLDNPRGYGRILKAPDGSVSAIVEEKAADEEIKKIREVNPGIYCFEAKHLWPHLRQLRPNPAANEIYLTDVVESFVKAGLRVMPHPVTDPFELLGINNRVELAEVDQILRRRKAHELMVSGVTIQLPDTVIIDKHVEVGQDTVIGPFVHLTGKTKIGEGCRIGSSCFIHSSVLEDGVQINQLTTIQDSYVESGAELGPYSRLRPNVHVEAGAYIGNFVELKKTRFGAGSKASHLTYLGDATIGKKVNVGAGTIICNYDGRKKNQTKIGDNAFIGSNSTLVSPLEIGSGAYVGAGSVVTDTVPEDALALARGRQVTKAGWARRRREAGAAEKVESR